MAMKRQKPAPQLSIIIVNYNVREFLHHALVSLQKAMKGVLAQPATSHPFYWAGFMAIGR